jgi:polyisoprenoid-binding protein YceI
MYRRIFALSLLLVAAVACSAGAASSPTAAKPTATHVSSVETAPAAATPGSAATASGASASTDSAGAIHLQLADSGNEARYRVREQLARLNLPSGAIGKTSAVTGAIVINPDGSVVSDASKFVVDVTGLTSDEGRRDNFVKRNVLETGTYPTVEFVPRQAMGLPSPLPTSGDVSFQLAGDMTIHGVTRPTTWDVTATVTNGSELAGTATTAFKFADFGLNQPRVPVVLSVEDNIKLEIDFHLVKGQ